MERRKIVQKVLFHFVLIHIGLSLVHLLSYQISHPLFKYLKSTPFALQLVVLLVLSLIFYTAIGWIYTYFFKDKFGLDLQIERIVIYFGLGFMSFYALIYYLAQSLFNPNIMLSYVIMNPWFGTYFIKMCEEDLYSLWWMLSSLTPALGLYIGVKLELWMEGGY